MTNASAAQRKPNLPAAIAKLHAAIDRLIKPGAAYQNSTYIEVPGLYQQLVDGIVGFRNAGASGIARSRPPMWVDAEDQKANIDLMVSVWPTGAAGNTVKQLRALADKEWSVEQTRQVRKLATIIEAWCDDIVNLLNEVHTKYLFDKDEDGRWSNIACPACGVDTVYRQDVDGENIRQPALRIVAEYGASCANCGYYWAPNQYMELATELGCERPEGVLQ